MNYDREKYIYGSAWLSAVEASAPGADRFRAAAASRDAAEAQRILFGDRVGAGAEAAGGSGEDSEQLLSETLKKCYSDLDAAAPDPALFGLLRYPYDCHNLKTVLKTVLRRNDPAEDGENVPSQAKAAGSKTAREIGEECAPLLLELGTVEGEKAVRAVLEGDYSLFPEKLAEAAAEARTEFSKSRDPQLLDSLLDRGCYAAMAEAAENSGIPFLGEYVSVKADTVNFLTALRVVRLYPEPLRTPQIEAAFVPGGTIAVSLLSDAAAGEALLAEEALIALSEKSALAPLKLSAGMALGDIERDAEKYILSLADRAAKEELYGGAPLVRYVLFSEAAVRNARIVLSGVSASIGADAILSRLRI